MLHPAPNAEPEADSRRTSVDLQASLSVHFDETSFDLLNAKVSLPEHDSLGDLDMDISSLATKAPERGDSREDVEAFQVSHRPKGLDVHAICGS